MRIPFGRSFVALTVLCLSALHPGTSQAVAQQAAAAPAVAPFGELAGVLRRAGERVAREAQEATVVLADEVCQQRAFKEAPVKEFDLGRMPGADKYTPVLLPGTGEQVKTAQRRWRAEMARVPLPDLGRPAVPWMEIRDIVEVDGKALPDRAARLQRMLKADPDWTAARAREVVEDNARFNIGPVRRTFNTPTLPLLVLHPLNQPRFTFTRVGEERVNGEPTWKVAFRESVSPTLISDRETGASMPSAGIFWIRPDSGEVVRASLQSGARAESQLIVDYRQHPTFGLSLPHEMVENTQGDDRQWVEGRCSYTNFRRFETSGRLVIPK